MTPPENTYDTIIQLPACGFYYIHVCPRTKTNGVLDDQMDGAYWETFCTVTQFPTRVPTPGGNLPPPWITSVQTLSQILTRKNAIKIWWMSSKPYDAWNVRWNQDGAPPATDSQSPEIDSPGSGGWFVCGPTKRGVSYHIVVEGGESAGILVGHNWSGWSPEFHVVAGDNYHSLREFLQASGVDGTKGLRPLLRTIGRVSVRSVLGV